MYGLQSHNRSSKRKSIESYYWQKIVGEEEIRANNIESTLLVKENGKALIMAGNVITEYEYDNTNFYFYIDGEKNSVKWVYKNNMLSLIQDDNYKWTYRRK